jgi:microcystin-dependent protein
MTNLERKMTDKTPKNKAENPVNTPATLAGTTDKVRDSEPKSRALPQADALKARFKAGSIPLQTDFADLIDLANMGRQAVGGAEGQTGPANGFTLSSTGRLELKPNAVKGISVDQDGVAIKLKTISGLTMNNDGVSVKPKADSGIELKDSAGISIKPGNGISVDKDGIAVKAEGNKGLQVNNNGVSVKTGNGIAVNSSGVNIKLAKGSNHTNGGGGQGENGTTSGYAGGLVLSSEGLSVDAGNGLQIDFQGVSIKLSSNSGLSADESNGLKIVPEQMFQKGMVMMFAGTEAEMPKGWALCDGNGGRPDLRDRFIVGKGSKFTGRGEGTTSTGEATVTGSVSVKDTKLTLNQIPNHSHNYNEIAYRDFGYYHGDSRKGMIDTSNSVSTSSAGGSMGHKHDATLTINSHKHSIDPIPPYYALAFIIKL